MGLKKRGAAFGQALDMGRLGLWVAAEALQVIIEIVANDEQYVGLIAGMDNASQGKEDRKKQTDGLHGFTSLE